MSIKIRLMKKSKRYKGNYEIYHLEIRRNGINISKSSKSLEKLLKIRN